MQYNGPFDQPTSPNASYVNGNPAVGTQGSIPPAPAIELPQREIVAVINYAFENGLVDFNQFHCVGPNNGISTQLLSAIEGMIGSALKLQFDAQGLVLIQLEMSASQLVTSNTQTLINSFSTVVKNTLVTSTFTSGSTLTIGSGEDGLWGFNLGISYGNQPDGWSTYTHVHRIRNSVNVTFSNSYVNAAGPSGSNTTAIELFSTGSIILDANVGDQFQFSTSVWGSFSPTNFLIENIGTEIGLSALPSLSCYRILPAPFIKQP